MTRPKPNPPKDGAAAFAATEAVVAPSAAVATIKQLDVLQGDEIIQLIIKPSIWYVFFLSVRWAIAGAVAGGAAVLSASSGWTPAHSLVCNLAVLLVLTRVAYAILQWASRVYLLTNRRVMRIKGVLRADMRSLLLHRISAIELRSPIHQRWLNLGTLEIRGTDERAQPVHWTFVLGAEDLRETLQKAIQRAQSGGTG